MNRAWIKPGVWGFVIGGVVTMIVGFSWGGWTTTSTTDRLAMDRSTAAVTAALVPVCLEKSKADPARAQKLAASATFQSGEANVEHWIGSIDGWITAANERYVRSLDEADRERSTRLDAEARERDRLQELNERFKNL
ncbi:MAG: hypothetical protein FJ027_16690 [Candidatus Rokubacteria bacterium]|nr:hypothetical protein [Candidatus Rokubacteria bacterium]